MLSVPPVTSTSARLKSVLASLSVKLMVAVWPVASVALSLLTTTVGGVVSMVKGVPSWGALGVLLPAGVTMILGT